MLLDVRCAAALRTRTRGGTPLAGAPLQHLLTHCKDEGLSATKASKRLCCYFAAICSAHSSRDRLTHCKDERFRRYETPSWDPKNDYQQNLAPRAKSGSTGLNIFPHELLAHLRQTGRLAT